MISDRRYASRPADAEIECFVGKLDRSYEPIAVVDSERYVLHEYGREDISDSAQAHNDDQKRRMLDDLKRLGRKLGGDAVHNIRMLSVEVQGMVLDERVPIPGAVRQGVSYRYFMRGEVVHLVNEIGLPPSISPQGVELEHDAPTSTENPVEPQGLTTEHEKRHAVIEMGSEQAQSDTSGESRLVDLELDVE